MKVLGRHQLGDEPHRIGAVGQAWWECTIPADCTGAILLQHGSLLEKTPEWKRAGLCRAGCFGLSETGHSEP